jgi:hypothetical protein
MALESDPRLIALEERRAANVGKQIDNGALPAGSPMFYYCHGCGAQTAIKPEDWYRDPPPPRFCGECEGLTADGVLDPSVESYDVWLREHGKEAVRR